MKIACWSGPRNISTALMRSWSSRNDSYISDEPLYAYYLKEKQLDHPMKDEIINFYQNNYKDVLKTITSNIPNDKKIWYQKHMAHHLINLDNLEWLFELNNCILIRHPKYVINSYLKKNSLKHISELGYVQQLQIFNFLKKHKKEIVVIDSNILLNDTERILSNWCHKIGINYDSKMLSWEKGVHKYDGIWGKHWYNNVINSTCFKKPYNKRVDINKSYKKIYDESLIYYNQLLKHCLK